MLQGDARCGWSFTLPQSWQFREGPVRDDERQTNIVVCCSSATADHRRSRRLVGRL